MSDAKAIRQSATHIADAIDAHTKVLQDFLNFLNPAVAEAKMGSAEDDQIDDGVGEYKIEEHTRKQLKDKWIELGYPPELAEYIR